MSQYTLSRNELIEQLNKQIDFLERSCESYDKKYEDEACRIAVTIRVLVHDTKNSTSVLQHLKIKHQIDFWDSANPINPYNLISSPALVYLQLKNENGIMKSTYEPNLDNGPSGLSSGWQGFQHWWPRQIVLKDNKKKEFTRKDLVLNLANKDGGAHVDDTLNSDFANLLKFNSVGWKKIENGVEGDFDNNCVYASVRQIGYEILKSIKEFKNKGLLLP